MLRTGKPTAPVGAPPTADRRALMEWFEIYGKPVVDRQRLFVISLVLSVGVVVLAAGLVFQSQMREVVPYRVEVDDVGRVAAVPMGGKEYTPKEPEIRSAMMDWAEHILTLEPNLTELYLTRAYKRTRGKATEEFEAWVAKYQALRRLKEDPSLTGPAKARSINFITENTGIVRVRVEERSKRKHAQTKGPQVRTYVVTVHYTIIEPKNEEEIRRNPVGFFVTHFDVAKELAQ